MVNEFKFFKRNRILDANIKCAIITARMETFRQFREDTHNFYNILPTSNRWEECFVIDGKEYRRITCPNDLIGRRFDTFVQLHDAEVINGRYDVMNLLHLMGAREMF